MKKIIIVLVVLLICFSLFAAYDDSWTKQAIDAGNVSEIKDVKTSFYHDYTKYSALSYAISIGSNADVIDKILELGADINGNNSEYSPIYYCFKTMDYDTLLKLLDRGVNVKKSFYLDYTKYTPLTYALSIDMDGTIIDKILGLGANVDGIGSEYSPLYYCFKNNDKVSLLKILALKPRVDISFYINYTKYTPLTYALSVRMDDKIIDTLIELGADVDGTGSENSPLYYCFKNNDKKNLIKILNKSPDVNIDFYIDYVRYTPLTRALNKKMDSTLIDKLLELGADVDGGVSEHPPLYYSFENNDKESARKLLNLGANVHFEFYYNYYKFTPLSFVQQFRWDSDIVKKISSM